jgi:uncharacterized membrane protein
MRTPASIAGHPIHPMLVTIPIGLWLFSLVCDLVGLSGNADPAWAIVAFYTMAGGIAGALMAAVPGLIDLLSLRDAPRKTALIHMAINLTVVALFAVNLWMRYRAEGSANGPLVLSFLGIALLAVSGWLGGKLVYEHGVAVNGVEETSAQRVSAADVKRAQPMHGERALR